MKKDIDLKKETWEKIEFFVKRVKGKTVSDFIEDAVMDYTEFLQLIEEKTIEEMNDEIEDFKEKFLNKENESAREKN